MPDRSAREQGDTMKPALLFDLDGTLMVEEPAAEEAFRAAAQVAADRCDIDPGTLAEDVRTRARELWYAAPTHDYCMRIGISSWEGLWCRFDGERPEVRALRGWSPEYRREAWRLALADQGVDDAVLAEELGERFAVERRARHQVFADVETSLSRLHGSQQLALLTNGAACLQREKLAASGLVGYFEVVIVSADLGVAKPDAAIFEHALERLSVECGDAVMVGDSIAKDIDGARAAGMRAVWLNRTGMPPPEAQSDLVEIATLSELPDTRGE
jgi:putative hydrolase of the HAD superfamily